MTTILGGGISGLAAGFYFLQRFGLPTTIYESSTRLGGWIRTERNLDKGFIFEVGPRTIRPKGPAGANTLELLEKLKININAIPSTHEAAINRMIYANGKLCLLPNSLGGLFKKLPPFKKPLINALFNDIFTKSKKAKYGDESIYDFAERRFGSDIAKYAISPMICGICAGDAKEISVRFLMNDIFENEQKYGGVLLGLFLSKLQRSNKENNDFKYNITPNLYEKAQQENWSMYRSENGLETFPRALGEYLKNKNTVIKTSSDCREIIFDRESVIMNIKDQKINTNQIICSIPSYKLANCVKDQHPSLAAQLLLIPYVDVAVVNLMYSAKDLLKQKAFGLLVPPVEKLPILGIIFDSCCFDMHGNTVLTVMMGGKWFEKNFGENPSQKQLLDTALKYVEQILHIDEEPKMNRVHVLRKCIPQYTVGHKQRIQNIRSYIQNYKLPISLCGAAYDGVGINDVILSARKQVYGLPDINDNL